MAVPVCYNWSIILPPFCCCCCCCCFPAPPFVALEVAVDAMAAAAIEQSGIEVVGGDGDGDEEDVKKR